MKHLLNICNINGAEVEPFPILVTKYHFKKEILENPMFRIGVYAQRACKTFAALGIAAIAAANALDTAFRENNGL